MKDADDEFLVVSSYFRQCAARIITKVHLVSNRPFLFIDVATTQKQTRHSKMKPVVSAGYLHPHFYSLQILTGT